MFKDVKLSAEKTTTDFGICPKRLNRLLSVFLKTITNDIERPH